MAKMFEKSLMVSEDVQAMLYSGIFKDGNGDDAECENGALVVRGEMLEDIYGNADPNLYAISAPASASDPVGVVDFVGVSNGDIMGNTYREGIKTYGIKAEAGRAVRVRKLAKGDTGYFSAENIVNAAEGKYAVPTGSGAVTFTVDPAIVDDSDIPAGKTCIKIHFAKPIVEGTVETGTKYFVEFVNVI